MFHRLFFSSLIFGITFIAFAKVDLKDIVVGYDRAEGAYTYPLHAVKGHGELYLERIAIEISKNCAKFITIENRKLYCAPFGDKTKRFSFASFGGEEPESDSSWIAVFQNYDLSRVNLRVVPDHETKRFLYFLDIGFH